MMKIISLTMVAGVSAVADCNVCEHGINEAKTFTHAWQPGTHSCKNAINYCMADQGTMDKDCYGCAMFSVGMNYVSGCCNEAAPAQTLRLASEADLKAETEKLKPSDTKEISALMAKFSGK